MGGAACSILSVKNEDPAFRPGLFVFALYFYFTKLTITSMPIIFNFYLVCFDGVGGFWRVWGLDNILLGF